MLPDIVAWPVDLPEIQSDNARAIIEAKLREAAKLKPDCPLMVEDTSLYLDALGGLPGPLIKWFIAKDSLGLTGLFELAKARAKLTAKASTWIGLYQHGDLRFFEGSISGQIVSPRGDQGFGWDPIFVPDGSSHSFAEMSPAEKARYSMRSLALEQLKTHLAASSG